MAPLDREDKAFHDIKVICSFGDKKETHMATGRIDVVDTDDSPPKLQTKSIINVRYSEDFQKVKMLSQTIFSRV